MPSISALALFPVLTLLLTACGLSGEPRESAGPAAGQVAQEGVPGSPQEPAAQDKEVAFDQEHTLLTEVLRKHVKGDAVDYKALKKDRAKLDAYIAGLEGVTPEQLAKWTREQRYAFWINVYNANVLKLIVEHYPVDSIKDIGSLLRRVWNREFIEMNAHHPAGKDDALSLDDVEHKILRPRFKDARVHAAVNCASVGCPPLRAEAFVAERLDEQLDGQTRAWLADTARNRFDEAQRTLHLSKIFDWFEVDFRRDAGSVQAWVARFAPPAAKWVAGAEKPKLRYLDWSWKLNDTAPLGR